MDCRIISSNKKPGAIAAATLVELMIAILVGSLVFLVLTAIAVYTSRSFAALGNYMELDKRSRNTLDRMTQMIRESDGVLSWSNHELVLSYQTQPLSFTYKPRDKKLVMTETDRKSVV